MSNDRALRIVLVTAAAAYVAWRLQEANGGPIVWVNPLTAFLPGNPSPPGTDGAGVTNGPALTFYTGPESYKGAGNTSVLSAKSIKPPTSADPLLPPSYLTRTAQPERPPFIGEKAVKYLPNLGDPNMSAYDWLASTPPDAWGLQGSGVPIYGF